MFRLKYKLKKDQSGEEFMYRAVRRTRISFSRYGYGYRRIPVIRVAWSAKYP